MAFSVFFLLTMCAYTAIAFGYDNLPAQDGDMGGWFMSLVEMIKNWGSLGWHGIVAAMIVLVIGLTKISFIKVYWDKLGAWKFVIPLALGAVAELILNFPKPFQWGTFIGVIITGIGGSGALSIAVHHIFDKLLSKK
jgi:hypothetical protein